VYLQHHEDLDEQEKKIWEDKILNTFSSSATTTNTINSPKEKDIYIDEKHIFDLIALLLEIEGLKKNDIIKIQIDEKIEEAYFSKDDDAYHIPSTWKNPEVYTYFKDI
jgi:hypothetical protein